VWDYHERTADGPLAPPGRYVVRLSLGGRTYSQRLVLVRDPRIAATDADLTAQAVLARAVAGLEDRVGAALREAATLRAAHPAAKAQIDAVAGKPHVADPDDSTGSAASPDTSSLRYDGRLLAELEGSIESADARPTANEYGAWAALAATTERKLATWKTLRGTLPGGRT
jgi:hypothetical protein